MKHLLCASIILCAFLSGCATTTTQRNVMESFGLATERVGRMSESEFLSMRGEVIEMNSLIMVLDRTKGAHSQGHNEPAHAEATADRVAASKALRMYGDLLMRLAADDRTEMVRRSARVFLDNIAETLGPEVSVEQEEALQRVAQGLSARWASSKKAETARAVVLAFEGAVTTLTTRLMADFSVEESSTSYLKTYTDTARELKTRASAVIDAGDKVDLQERDKAVQALLLAQKSLLRAEAIGARIHECMATLQQANAHVASAVRNDSYDLLQIREYGKQIQKIGTMQQVLSR